MSECGKSSITGQSGQEVNRATAQIGHRTYDLDCALSGKHRAIFSDRPVVNTTFVRATA
jgi:hypothetical protein